MARRLFVTSFVLACAVAALAMPTAASAAFGPIAAFGNSRHGTGSAE